MADLAAALDPNAFSQIHRSALVHLERLADTRRDDLSRLFVRVKGSGQKRPLEPRLRASVQSDVRPNAGPQAA